MSPSEFRLIGGKSFIAEKHHDAIDKQADRQSEAMTKEAQKHHQVRLDDVPDVSKGEMTTIEKNKRIAEDRILKDKKREQNKKDKKQKLFEQESGLFVDLEG